MTEKIENILQYLDENLHPIISPEHWNIYSELHDMVSCLSMEPQWIPCSERLPDKSGWYLVTEEWDDNVTFVTRDRYVVGKGWTYAVFGTSVAWMPLPTPWEGEQE